MRSKGGDALPPAHEEEHSPRLQINADSPQTAKLSASNNVITRAVVVRKPQRNKRAT